jgi:transcriptional regulator with XRE-family HTH domain
MELKTLREKILADDKFRNEYYKKDLAVEMGEMVIDARVRLGLTQAELAERVGTKQPSIARLENGSRIPDLEFLGRIADSLGTYLVPPKFAFLQENEFANDAIYTSTAVMNWFAPCTTVAKSVVPSYMTMGLVAPATQKPKSLNNVVSVSIFSYD